MVKRFLISVALLIPVAIIAQIGWTKQVKNVPSYVANALGDPGSAGIVKRTTANTSTVAGGSDVWPGTLPYTAVTGGSAGVWPGTVPFGSVTGTSVAWPGTIPYSSVTSVTGAWPGTMPYSSLTSVPNLLGDPGANGVVKRTALNTTAAATGADLPLMVASGASHSAGAAPDPGAVAGTGRYLREDATWSVPGVSTQNANLQANSSRVLGNIYQNTTGKSVFVSVSINLAAANHGNAYTDAAATHLTQVVALLNSGSSTNTMAFSFWVMPNNYYQVSITGAGNSIAYWTEWF